jgi:hypothetical protein
MIEVLYANMHPHGQCRIFYQCYFLFFVQYFKRKKGISVLATCTWVDMGHECQSVKS